MMPPICAVCGQDFKLDTTKAGGLVSFSLTEAEAEDNKKFEEFGFTGHPAGLHWVCGKHYQRALSLKNLHSEEALSLLKKEFLETNTTDDIL